MTVPCSPNADQGSKSPGSMPSIAEEITGQSPNSVTLVLPVVQVMHVLELEMPPSGCLAPGASATLKVTFKPLVRSHTMCAISWTLWPHGMLHAC